MKQLRTATVIGVLALTLPALANKPTITEIPFTTPFTITGGPANGACTFDVLVTPQPNRPNGERLILFANAAIIAGPLFVTFTNLSDPAKTLSLNVSGPEVSFSANEVTLLGPGFLSGFPPDVTAAASLPAVFFATGRTVITFDPITGIATSITHVGTVQDLCQALQ